LLTSRPQGGVLKACEAGVLNGAEGAVLTSCRRQRAERL
jgi:hypothetical protein